MFLQCVCHVTARFCHVTARFCHVCSLRFAMLPLASAMLPLALATLTLPFAMLFAGVCHVFACGSGLASPRRHSRLAAGLASPPVSPRSWRSAMAGPAQNDGLGVIAGPVIAIPPRLDPPTVSCRKAHKFLNDCRTRYPDKEEVDLTDTVAFDWRNWLAGRKDRDEVVGEGVVKFLFRRLPETDHNTREDRTDFVVLRADGTAVPLHPTGRHCVSRRGCARPSPSIRTGGIRARADRVVARPEPRASSPGRAEWRRASPEPDPEPRASSPGRAEPCCAS